jgi:FtsP/CotA-like multicopper oxidase with cupredoxin domain
VQPFLRVAARKYRFRILAAGNARVFGLVLADSRGRRQRFDHIGNGGGLFSRTLRDEDFQLLGPAMRADIVVDFSQYRPGTELYLENRIDQRDGRGPGGSFDDVDVEGSGERIMKFIVGEPAPDPSRVPNVLRPFDAIPESVLRTLPRRTFRFDRRHGAWSVNGELVDLERSVARPRLNRAEIWKLENHSGGWWHPVHIHLELFRVLKLNGRQPRLLELRDGIARVDTVMLGGNDEAEVYVRFQDYPGPFVFHCHNVEHEDHFMMARFDAVP